jgi:hypothetical protein
MPNPSEAREYSVGTHPTRFEPPDLYVITFDGDYLEEHILAHCKIFAEGPEDFYILLGTAKLGAVPTETKKALKQMPSAAGLALFGATPQMKVVLSVLTKVYTMMSQGKTAIKFCTDEAEARAWIAQERLSAKGA